MRRKFLASSAVVGVLLLFAPPATASTNSLSGCWAGRNGITGGHSYCASGGTQGEQRVRSTVSHQGVRKSRFTMVLG